MSVMKEMKVQRKTNKRRLRERADGGSSPADWMSADPELLQRVVAKITVLGGAIRFGYTRDGGAYAVGIYIGEKYDTEYVRPQEDLNEYLRGLLEYLELEH
jgi:hypothetical protein